MRKLVRSHKTANSFVTFSHDLLSWCHELTFERQKGTQSPLQTQVERQMLVCMHSPCLTFASMQHGSRLSRSCLEVWTREKRRSGVDLTLWCFYDVFRVAGMHCKCTLQNTANCSIAFANKSCLPASGSQYGSKFYIAALKLYTAIAVYIYMYCDNRKKVQEYWCTQHNYC